MSTKKYLNSSVVPLFLGIIAIGVGCEFLIYFSPNIAIPAILLGAVLISLSILARRKSSTPLERILMLNPRDERESKQIQWGFSLVGKLTLILIFAIFVGILIFSGYAWFTNDFAFSDCFVPYGTTNQVCSPNAMYYFAYSSVYVLGIFGFIALFSSILAVVRKV